MNSLKIIIISLLFCFSLSLNFQLPIFIRDDKEDEKIISKIIDGILELVMEKYELFNDTLPQLTSNCSETLDRTFFILKKKIFAMKKNI